MKTCGEGGFGFLSGPAWPKTLAGSMLGYINIGFLDRLAGQDIPKTANALMLDGSSFSATRLRP